MFKVTFRLKDPNITSYNVRHNTWASKYMWRTTMNLLLQTRANYCLVGMENQATLFQSSSKDERKKSGWQKLSLKTWGKRGQQRTDERPILIIVMPQNTKRSLEEDDGCSSSMLTTVDREGKALERSLHRIQCHIPLLRPIYPVLSEDYPSHFAHSRDPAKQN